MKKFRIAVVALYFLSFVSPVVSLAATAPKKVNNGTTKKEVKSSFVMKNSQVTVGDKWSSDLNFVSATDDAGKKLVWKDISKNVTTKGTVDTAKVGKYPVTYTWNKITQTVNVEVIEKPKPKIALKEIKAKSVTITQGQNFDVSQVFESATTTDGKVLSYNDVVSLLKVENLVNTNQPGTYNVTFTSGTLKAVSTVTVVAKKVEPTELKVVNSTLKVGNKWSPNMNFQGVLMSDGTMLNWNQVAKDLVVSGGVDTTKAGNYDITYQYGNFKQTITVTVEAKEIITVQEIKVKDTTLTANAKWEAKDNFDYVLLSNGQKQTWDEIGKDIVVKGAVDTTKPDTYKVTYTYGGKESVATINVKAQEIVKVQEVVVKDSTLELNAKWQAKDNFNYVLMSDGTKREFKDIEKELKIKGEVNTKKAGTYKVVYTLEDKSATATINVKAQEVVKVQEISVKDTNLPRGTKWEARDNFNYVLMSDGTKRQWKDVEKDIKVTGKVDNQQAGTYKVTYKYEDKEATAKVTVKDMEVIKVQSITLKNTTLDYGSKWEAKDNFVSARLTSGVDQSWKDVAKDIKVKGSVDTQKPGTYKVVYTLADKSETATITVKEKKKAVVKPTTKTTKKTYPVTTRKTLPQTGTKENIKLFVGGISLVIGVGSLLIIKLRKEEL